MKPSSKIAKQLFEQEQQIGKLGRTSQVAYSTVGGEAAIPVATTVAEAAVTNEALPVVQDDAADGNTGVSDLQDALSASDDDLDARFEQAAAELANARAEIESSEQALTDAFGVRFDGMSEDIQTAIRAAGNAQSTADGIPLILFSTVRGPSDGSDLAPTGSTWFLIDTTNNIAGQWQQTGPTSTPTWTPRAIVSDVIANLDVGKLTAGQAAIATLVAQKIAASTASFQTVNVANLFVTSGATMNQATIDYLFANVVQAKKITASMIDVSTLNGVSITGLSIVGGYFQTTASDSTGSRTTISGGVMKVDNTKASGSSTIYSPGEFLRFQATDGAGRYATLDITPTGDITVPKFVFDGGIKIGNGGLSANNIQDSTGVLLATKNTGGWSVYANDYRRADGSSIGMADVLVVNPAAAVPVNGTTDVTARFTNASGRGLISASAWNTTDGFTVPAGMDGMWQLSLSIRSVSGGQAFLQVNGTYVAFQDGTNATLNTPLYLSSGDKVRLFMFSSSSSNSAQAATRFTAIRLGS